MRGLCNQCEPIECLNTLEEHLFIELFLGKEVQVEGEPMAELKCKPGPSGEVETVEEPCVPEGA
jgi:hypothetical protein